MNLLTGSPWIIERVVSRLYINNIYDSADTFAITRCDKYGTLVFNQNLSGSFQSVCGGNKYGGRWSIDENNIEIQFLIPAMSITGYGIHEGVIKKINKKSLVIEHSITWSGGINPATNEMETLKRVEEIQLSR